MYPGMDSRLGRHLDPTFSFFPEHSLQRRNNIRHFQSQRGRIVSREIEQMLSHEQPPKNSVNPLEPLKDNRQQTDLTTDMI
jgi:hypothetical protein